jgi:hypothetical protein
LTGGASGNYYGYMLRQSQTLGIVFTDISGSTSLYEFLGDENAHKIVSSCISALSAVTADYQGTAIRPSGRVMCTFPDSSKAVNASMACRRPWTPSTWCYRQEPVPNMRIGIHWGSVIKQNYGRVRRRSELASAGLPGETPPDPDHAADRGRTSKGIDVNIKAIDRTTIKGKSGNTPSTRSSGKSTTRPSSCPMTPPYGDLHPSLP